MFYPVWMKASSPIRRSAMCCTNMMLKKAIHHLLPEPPLPSPRLSLRTSLYCSYDWNEEENSWWANSNTEECRAFLFFLTHTFGERWNFSLGNRSEISVLVSIHMLSFYFSSFVFCSPRTSSTFCSEQFNSSFNHSHLALYPSQVLWLTVMKNETSVPAAANTKLWLRLIDLSSGVSERVCVCVCVHKLFSHQTYQEGMTQRRR